MKDPPVQYSPVPPELDYAIFEMSYPRLYQVLSGLTGIFSPPEAYRVLSLAVTANLDLEAFEAILTHCPPVPEILSAGRADGFLIKRVVSEYRSDLLSVLLARGASPNRIAGDPTSPLEAALMDNSLRCVEVLMEQPELDTTWTLRLLHEWAKPYRNRSLEEDCLRAIAPRFTGWDPNSGQPLPIPEPMRIEIIAQVGNWSLLERFCRERGPISPKEGSSVIRKARLAVLKLEKGDQYAFACALDALLECCPDLLEKEKPCKLLLYCFLSFGKDAGVRLRPWVESLGPRQIVIKEKEWKWWQFGGLLKNWQALQPRGLTLVIDRWSDVFSGWQFKTEIGHILRCCLVQGEGRKGKLSPLAQAALRCGDLLLIQSLFRQPNGMLAAEDPDALAEYVQNAECSRAIRAAVLAHIRRDVDYTL